MRREKLRLVGFLIAMAGAPCLTSWGETIGSALIQRALKDVNSGQVYIYDGTSSPFKSNGVASSWSFYDTTTNGGVVTPLLFQKITTNSFVLTGIGTSRLSDASGVQSYSFDLIAGSDAVLGGSYTFGFTNRVYTFSNETLVAGPSTAGVVPHDAPAITADQWLETAGAPNGGGPITLAIGTQFGTGGLPFFDNGGGKQRIYSAQLTTVPEPASLSLLGSSGFVLLIRRRR